AAVERGGTETEGLRPVRHVAEAALRLLVHLAHGSFCIRRGYGANEGHDVSSRRNVSTLRAGSARASVPRGTISATGSRTTRARACAPRAETPRSPRARRPGPCH